MKEKDAAYNSSEEEEEIELIEKEGIKKNNLEINKLKENLGYAPAPGAGNSNLNFNPNLNLNNIINKENNNNLGAIQKPLNILVLDGSRSVYSLLVSNIILSNGFFKETDIKVPCSRIPGIKNFVVYPVVESNGAYITRVLCDDLSVENGSSFKKLCDGNFEVEDYDVIVVVGLNPNSDKDVLDFVANKIKNGEDNNLIVYGDNWLSNGQNMNWFKYHLKYEFSCQELLEKIASFNKDLKQFVGWEGKDKDPNYEQNKIDGLKSTAGEIAPKVNLKDNLNPGSSGRALNVLKNHYGKILIGFGVFEEIVFGKVRKNLPKIFKSKEVKNKNKEKKGAEDNKSASSDVEKERTL